MIKALKDNKDSLPWHWYLKKLIGSVTSSWKRTPMRRNRRQPDRLDLPGKLRSHTAKILSASTSAAASPTPNSDRPSAKSCSSFAATTMKSSSPNATTRLRRTYRIREPRRRQRPPGHPRRHRLLPVFDYSQHPKHRPLGLLHRRQRRRKTSNSAARYKVLWVLSGHGETLSLKNPYAL